MKLAFIPPNNHLELSLRGDFLFTLAQIAYKDPKYVELYKKQSKYKIIDNGCAEGETVTPRILLGMASKIKADEVVVPDALYQGAKTTLMFKDFINVISEKELQRFRLMVVPQAEDKGQYLHCLDDMLRHELCPKNIVVGISKFSTPRAFGSRVCCVEFLINECGLKNEMHLLGTTSNLAEVVILKKYPQVRSNDSCIAILSAIEGVKFSESNIGAMERVKTTNTYFNKRMSDKQMQLARYNIDIMKKCAKQSQ